MKLNDYKGEYVLVSREDCVDDFDLVETNYLIGYLDEWFEDVSSAKNAIVYCAVEKVIEDIDITDTITDFVEGEIENNEVSDNLRFDTKDFKNIMKQLNSWIKSNVGIYFTEGGLITLSEENWDSLRQLNAKN